MFSHLISKSSENICGALQRIHLIWCYIDGATNYYEKVKLYLMSCQIVYDRYTRAHDNINKPQHHQNIYSHTLYEKDQRKPKYTNVCGGKQQLYILNKKEAREESEVFVRNTYTALAERSITRIRDKYFRKYMNTSTDTEVYLNVEFCIACSFI